MIRPLCCDLCSGRPACADACTYGAITYEPNGEQEILYRRGRVVELE